MSNFTGYRLRTEHHQSPARHVNSSCLLTLGSVNNNITVVELVKNVCVLGVVCV